MKANHISTAVTFKRSIAGIIISLLSAAVCAGVAVIFIVLLFSWGADALAIFIVLVFLTYSIVFIAVSVILFKQPSKITLTADKKVIIGNNKKTYYAENVNIELYKEDVSNKTLIIILMGLLPGMFLFISLGVVKLNFNCGRNKYLLRYASEKNIEELFKALEDCPSSVLTRDEEKWRNKFQKR